MRKYKVITDFHNSTDADLDLAAANAVKGLTGNASFTFGTNQLKDFGTDATDYHDSLAALVTGGKTAVTAKKCSKRNLAGKF